MLRSAFSDKMSSMPSSVCRSLFKMWLMMKKKLQLKTSLRAGAKQERVVWDNSIHANEFENNNRSMRFLERSFIFSIFFSS